MKVRVKNLLAFLKAKKDIKNAIDFLKNKRGFNEYPDGFVMAQAILGEIGWQEGFMGTISDEEWGEWSKI